MIYGTYPGETGPSTVLSDPSCVGTQIKEEQKEEMDIKNQFVMKEEEGEMIPKEEEIEEGICPTIVPCEYWLYVSMISGTFNNFGPVP